MKLLLTGDWHLTDKVPSRRIDDFVQAMKTKVNHIVDFAIDNNVKAILQPGDLFDKCDSSYGIVEWFIRYFNEKNFYVPIYACLGQHDQRYHKAGNFNTANGCFFAGIERTGSRIISNSEPITLVDDFTKSKVCIHAASWGEPIPDVPRTGDYHILLTHRMITKDGPLWEGQEGNTDALDLLKQTSFRLIVSGDNHNSFTQDHRMKYLVNCGSLMRSKIDQVNHKPVFYIYDTASGVLEEHFIPCDKVVDVFELEKKREEDEKDEKMERFINTITTKQAQSLSFTDNLIGTIKTLDLPDYTKEVLDEVLASIGS